MIVRDKSWDIKDASKLQTYLECPRSYFYQYILGWRLEAPNIHLEFGKAWHLAMEHLLLEGYSIGSIAQAYILFQEHYRKFFPEVMDLSNSPKDPANAMRALVQYAQTYEKDNFKTMYTEIAGTVPLTDKHILHFRMDSILQREDGLYQSLEHKTGSQLSRQWTDQWSLSMQTGVYNHVLCCLFPPEQVYGVEINGVFFQKGENKFQRVPARRTPAMMEAWYWETIDLMNTIQDEHNRLNECKEGDSVLKAFPRNPTNCTKYFGCPYHDFCMAWSNPLQRIDEVPYGFITRYWNPADEESTAKQIFRLEGRQ
jgi:hypothetical protein